MDFPELIAALSDPAAYPEPPLVVEVRQTHISAVFLAGPFVYKVKKPVAPGFLDFTTLDRRRHFCHEEVRLNHRLAPGVYLGVVPIVRTPTGVRVEGNGEVIEWAVKMCRLPDDATLLALLRRGAVDTRLIEALARRIATFHRDATTSDRIAALGRFDEVARNIRDVFDRAAKTAPAGIFAVTRHLAEARLTRLRPLIDARALRGVTRDCHGDLHLDHVYVFPERPPPANLVVIDCIEFSERIRVMDPVADMAFVVMDLAFHGRRDLARAFADAYFAAANDDEGRALLPLYTAYRAAVRGMVEGLLLGESEVPGPERVAARVKSRAHWLLALGELEAPSNRPALVLVAGLPGTGKSTLARALGDVAGFAVIRSDVVRKELAGLPADEPSPVSRREALYSDAGIERTYRECLRRTEVLLDEGRRVIVDATFREEPHRLAFLDAAVRHGVPALLFVCEAASDVARARLEMRRGDASDADWAIYHQVAGTWDEPGDRTKLVLHAIRTDGSPEDALAQACGDLCETGLLEADGVTPKS